ncbi:MAG: Rpn family recombination-promoting nuclease/putative transposase [Moorellaceae bacterium]
MPVDHDAIFKELITNFFKEFMELFFPQAHALIDYSDLTFLTQEIITDITAGEKHYVDILARVKIKGEEGYVLIHVEPQAYKEPDFARRMFIYFSRLYEKHQKKILPIAVFSYDSKTEEPDKHEVAFSFLKVLEFKFYKVQLKKLSWREYLKSDNPVAAALLSNMDYSPKERRRLKVEFTRMVTRMQLDPAKLGLITAIFDTYLGLSPEEEREVEEMLHKELSPEEVKKVMELRTSWHIKGWQEGLEQGRKVGLEEGRREILLRQLKKRLGFISPEVEEKIKALTLKELDELAEKIFEVSDERDVRALLGIAH